MKKAGIALAIVIFLPILSFCNQKSGFIVTGNIQGLDTGIISLTYRNIGGEDTAITTRIAMGKFTLKGDVAEAQLVRLNIKTGWPYSVSFFLENADIKISMVKDAYNKTEISGSASNAVYEKLEPQQRAFFENARNYDAAHQQAQASNNKLWAAKTDSVWGVQQHQWIATIQSAIKSEAKNYAGLYFIKWLSFHPPSYDTIMSLFMLLDPVVRNGFSGMDFLASFQHNKQISVGQPAPEIAGKDTSGRDERLASLRGQVVLLDFWASYCGICRQTNPQLKAVYEKYHLAGFEILSVSLDFEKTAWVKAIQNDKMTWHHASELRGGAAASAGIYDVQDMPRSWLIDRKGNIIAKDLSINELNQKLQQILERK